MKTIQSLFWKRILLMAWILTAFACVIWGTTAILEIIRIVQEEKHGNFQEYVNDSIRVDEAYPNREYVRIYNINTCRYVSPKMRWVSLDVSEGDSITVYCDMKGKRGFINLNTGGIVIEGRYDHAWNFSEGLAAVCQDMKIGFINIYGEEVIPCQYPTSQHVIHGLGYAFHDGLCAVTNSKDECGLINQFGELVVDTIYDCIWRPCGCDIRIVQDSNKYGAMNLSGKLILPIHYDDLWCSGQRIFAIKDGIMSQIDSTGLVIKPFCSEYGFTPMYLYSDSEQEFPTGHFLYYAGTNVGVIDTEGTIIIPAIYNRIYQLSDNLFEAEYNWNYEEGNGTWIPIRIQD